MLASQCILRRFFGTYIIAPPDCGVVGAADSATVVRAGSVARSSIEASKVRDALLDSALVGSGVVATSDAVTLTQPDVVPAAHSTGLGEVELGILLRKLRVNLLDGAIECDGRSVGNHDIPGQSVNSIARNRRLGISNLLTLSPEIFGETCLYSQWP
jgi:hypothetical protein